MFYMLNTYYVYMYILCRWYYRANSKTLTLGSPKGLHENGFDILYRLMKTFNALKISTQFSLLGR